MRPTGHGQIEDRWMGLDGLDGLVKVRKVVIGILLL